MGIFQKLQANDRAGSKCSEAYTQHDLINRLPLPWRFFLRETNIHGNLSLMPDDLPSLMSYFYSSQGLGVRTANALIYNIDQTTQEIINVKKGGGKGGNDYFGIFTVRHNFIPTPLWAPSVVTDSNGDASVTVTLPDQLTTWVLDARAYTLPMGDTQTTLVGQTTTSLVSTKPLLIRPEVPRFFVAGDNSVMSAIVNNNTDTAQQVAATLDITGATVSGDLTQYATIAANSRLKFDWPITVLNTQAVDMTFKVASKGGQYTDAAKPITGTGDDRVLIVMLSSRLANWKQALLIIKPDTVLRWHRDLFRLVWRHRSRVKSIRGRPRLGSDQVALIRRIAAENISWGTERIRGELLKLGFPSAKSTIQHYLKHRRAVKPGNQTWHTFLRNHASEIWACDFLQTYDLCFRVIFIFPIIELSSRRVVHIGVTRHPTELWGTQQLREATPFGEGPQFLIRDNDKKYGGQFDRAAAGAGIKVIRTPIASPKANAICERFMGSLRRECLDFVVIINDHHLLKIVAEYVHYFNQARPHQGIGQAVPLPKPSDTSIIPGNKVVGISVLNGLHHDYHRRAA